MTIIEKWQLASEKLDLDPISIRLRPSVHAKISELAATYNVSKNSVINDLLLDALNILQSEYKANTDKRSIIIL